VVHQGYQDLADAWSDPTVRSEMTVRIDSFCLNTCHQFGTCDEGCIVSIVILPAASHKVLGSGAAGSALLDDRFS
jgi:hypothetical protein